MAEAEAMLIRVAEEVGVVMAVMVVDRTAEVEVSRVKVKACAEDMGLRVEVAVL